MKNLMTSLITFLAASQAFATGGYFCQAQGSKISFQADGGITHGLGNPLLNTNGTLQGRLQKDGKKFPLNLKLTKENVSQYWNSGNEFKLLFYTENDTPSFNETTVEINTKANSDGSTFKGTATVRHTESGTVASVKIPVTCMTE